MSISVSMLEQHAERAALAVVRGANFTQCLMINGIEAALDVTTPQGKQLTFHGRDLYNERAWKKFLASLDPVPDLCMLTTTVDKLVQQYRTWLLTTYTRRYRMLSKQADLQWFEQVTMLVVIRRIMERKYEAFTFEQREAFADSWVAQEVELLMSLNGMAIEIAKSIHHIVKQPETALNLIEQLYITHAGSLAQLSRHPREPLAALPAGALQPLALLLKKDDEANHAR